MLHPIKVVAQRTGLSQHVIRVWEKRYRAVEPGRTQTNRRLYSESEIERLRLLHQLTRHGHTIGAVAGLGTEQLRHLAAQVNQAAPAEVSVSAPASVRSAHEDEAGGFVQEALGAIRALDDVALDRLLGRAAVSLGHQGLLQRVIVPLTQQIGEQWEAGLLKVAHEHFASSVLRTFLCNSAKPFSLPESAPGLIVATPAGQVHELGAVLVAATAANKGWRVTYLGTNLPATEIGGAAIQSKARAVLLSIVYPEDDPHLVQELVRLRQYLPPETAILCGGRAALSYQDTLDSIGAPVLLDLPQLCRQLDSIQVNPARRRGRPGPTQDSAHG